MRRFALILALACAMAGCKREPGFDERYQAASDEIVQRAQAIDAQVSGSGAPETENGDGDGGLSRPR